MKKIFFFFSIFLLIGAVVFYEKIPVRNNNVAGVSVANLVVYQKIADNNLTKLNFKYGDTALDLLKKTGAIKTKGEGKNAFVVQINNKKADEKNKEFWAFYVNGKMAEVGAGSYQLKNNDQVEWKLEKF